MVLTSYVQPYDYVIYDIPFQGSGVGQYLMNRYIGSCVWSRRYI